MPDCKIRYWSTKFAKTKELQPELINFPQFGEEFSESRFWVILVEILLLVQKQLVSTVNVATSQKWVFTQFFHNLAKSAQISVFQLF